MPNSLRFQRPMLAKDYEGHEGTIVYPCYVQPKLDGIRCITNGQTFWSRNGKVFPRQNFKHLQTRLPFPFLLDGELSLPGGVQDFEDIVSVVKRVGHANSAHIHFNAFDVITEEPYAARRTQLKLVFERHLLKIIAKNWQRVDTRLVKTHDELTQHYARFLERGYEGMMIRSVFGLYTPSRSLELLKYKPLKEAEFSIVRVKEAKGKDAGTPVFICEANGSEFAARPMGSLQARRRMWRDRKKLIGQQLTVEFQNWTKYGVPRFPRAKVLRDYE